MTRWEGDALMFMQTFIIKESKALLLSLKSDYGGDAEAKD
jgi:hypothetical protein